MDEKGRDRERQKERNIINLKKERQHFKTKQKN